MMTLVVRPRGPTVKALTASRCAEGRINLPHNVPIENPSGYL